MPRGAVWGKPPRLLDGLSLTNKRSFDSYGAVTKASTAPVRANRDTRTHAAPTREVILDTAERLFAGRGVDGVAMRDLAREMNLTAPSLYNHFAGKQALYEAVLQRGLSPILNMVVEAWHPGFLHPEGLRATTDRLTAHLAQHPHLARLLQRALLEESNSVQAMIARWLQPLYDEGMAVIAEGAGAAGWSREELPHLAIGLFGMLFAYFTNATAVRTLIPKGHDLFTARSLAVQRRFQEKALARLLAPLPVRARPSARTGRRRKPTK